MSASLCFLVGVFHVIKYLRIPRHAIHFQLALMPHARLSLELKFGHSVICQLSSSNVDGEMFDPYLWCWFLLRQVQRLLKVTFPPTVNDKRAESLIEVQIFFFSFFIIIVFHFCMASKCVQVLWSIKDFVMIFLDSVNGYFLVQYFWENWISLMQVLRYRHFNHF